MTNKIGCLPCFKSSSELEFGCKVLTTRSNLSDYLKTCGGFKQQFCGYTIGRCNMVQRSHTARSRSYEV